MTRNLIGIINDLNNSESIDEKKALSKLASAKLNENNSQVSSFLTPIIDRLSFSPELSGFEAITESEFYELNLNTYVDIDDSVKISIRISFLQDFENSNEFLDEMIALKIVKELQNNGLDIIVNDVCINLIQYRNGSRL